MLILMTFICHINFTKEIIRLSEFIDVQPQREEYKHLKFLTKALVPPIYEATHSGKPRCLNRWAGRWPWGPQGSSNKVTMDEPHSLPDGVAEGGVAEL